MTKPDQPEKTVVLDAVGVANTIRRMAQEIVAANPDPGSLLLLGILSRGKPLAERLAAQISEMTGVEPGVGRLATTLYRDDIRSGRVPGITANGHTHFDFDVDGATVVVVDDVLSTGRTVRAALDEIMDYGRPKCIRLACLVDRGLRELPIQADYQGWSLATKPDDHVSVLLTEADAEDAVLLERAPEASEQEGDQ